ncbi:MAG: pyruvate, phosphate dikinase, partial [Spirochaetales bacterium]|nr:pyruvate, phosphate dikinase [Spirochaetales bacterium]
MKKNIHFFSRNSYIKDKQLWEKLGIRGKEAMGFAALDLPILPGFIIDSKIAAHLENEEVSTNIKTFIKKCEKITGKVFGDTNNPLLVKIVISPNLAIVNYPALHNFGLTDNTISGFTDFVGEDFGYHEILFQIKGFLQIEQKIAELQNKNSESKVLLKKIDDITKYINSDIKADKIKKIITEYRKLLPDNFYSDVYTQLEIVLKRISFMLSLDELDDDDAALIVQPMVYGNYGKDSASGQFFTRDVVTGDDKLSGWFDQNKFNSIETKGKDIQKIGSDFLKDLIKVARIVEDHFKEIRAIRFTIENGRVWLIDQRPLMSKSTQSDIKCLLALYKRKVITKEYLINAVKPEQLNEILHPIINPSSVKGFKSITGGVAGAPGAAIGRVYFTTNGLIDAFKLAQQKGLDTRLILCMTSTFAEDVKAIEVATGVLSAEGGYAAHASVVARQYGKISLVANNLKV